MKNYDETLSVGTLVNVTVYGRPRGYYIVTLIEYRNDDGRNPLLTLTQVLSATGKKCKHKIQYFDASFCKRVTISHLNEVYAQECEVAKTKRASLMEYLGEV